MILHTLFILAFVGNVFTSMVVERGDRATVPDCASPETTCTIPRSSVKSDPSSSSSATITNTTSSTTTTTIPVTSGSFTANFAASATAAHATCGAGFLPQAATDQARSLLQSNTTGVCSTISPGWPCFGVGMEGSDYTVPSLISAFSSGQYYGTVAFLCNLGLLPMITQGFDTDVLDDLIHEKHCANYTPAALVSEGEWMYGYLDWKTVEEVGQSRELCAHVMSEVVAYPSGI